MAQNTNLNTSPYFDDFDPTKNYQRVLFKPGTPIQARELTTLQTILQDQVEKFGKHFLKEGAVVIPGNIAYDSEYTCVQIDPSHLGLPVSVYISNFVGKQIRGSISGVIAKVERVISDLESENNNYTLYVKYQSSGEGDFTTSVFQDGEDLVSVETIDYGVGSIRQDSTFATCIINDAAATGSAAKIENGVYFIRGFFVDVFAETLILDQYGNTPSYRVGLNINEEISVASQSNQDLFDNARGFSNFAAPGADRLKISATLAKKSLDDFNDESFVELMRIENGILSRFIKKVELDKLITDIMARRTYDESGDYYIKPFTVTAKESLNNGIGNNGVFNFTQLTTQGNVPSDDLFNLQISPGKAYVRGYEVETISTINLDVDKPRTTASNNNTSVTINLGNQLELNNVYGTTNVGFGTTSQVRLFSNRTNTQGTASGIQVGLARIYDLKLKNSAYANNGSVFESILYDIQTYTYLNLNTTITLSAPAYIEGKNSGATGFLAKNASNTNELVLYQTTGKFSLQEAIIINGVENTRIISKVNDYSISDVHQITGTGLSGNIFTADTILNQNILLAPVTSGFTISTANSGISTITTSNINFGVGIQTGDIISYTKPGEILPTYNRVTTVNASSRSIIVEATTSVANVCSGTLPTTQVSSNEVFKVVPRILNSREAYLYEKLEHRNISSVDLSSGNLIFRKSYPVTISSNSFTVTLESDTTITAEPFDEEDYTIIYSNGTIEPLDETKFSITAGRTVTFVDLSVASGSATLIATLKKQNLKPRRKVHKRAGVLNITRSSLTGSGVGNTSLNDGLTYSTIYGTRVQDDKISLQVPDVTEIIAIFESNDTNEPDLPKLQIKNLNTNILNTITGEIIYGSSSNARAMLVSNNGSNRVDFVYVNENSFIPDEKVTFLESNLVANVDYLVGGDRDIINDFIFNSGQEKDIVNYSYIERKSSATPPSKKLKIVYNYYYINPSDEGNLVVSNSYDINRFTNDKISFDGNNVTDLIDLRPRVVPYDPSTNTFSPFEWNARTFSSVTNSSSYILAKNKNLNLSYNYYLGRIDRLYLDRTGEFILTKGVPSISPVTPDPVDGGMEVATITLPPYVYNIEQIKVKLVSHKRYRMKDISLLEDRIKNVEYYSSLSLLETETRNLVIRDSTTGLDRFKSGFLVDNFKTNLSGSLGDSLHRCSIDTVEGVVRPQHYTSSVDLLLGSEAVIGVANTSNPNADLRFVSDLGSPNSVKVGDVVCLKYSDVVWLQNRFATRSENVNPFNVVNWVGVIELNPATDTWVETRRSRRDIDIEGSYSSAVQSLGVDTNTGLSPIDWGSWETTWTGTTTTNTSFVGRIQTGTDTLSSSESRGGFQGGRGIPITTTTNLRDSFINFNNVTTLTTTNQSRQGIQYRVGERIDTTNLGDRVVSTDVIHTMRSRNIEFIGRRLKPRTRLYAFFDNVAVSNYIIPKLIEIQMQSGTFSLGETVSGTLGTVSIRFRLAKLNHKYGPYNNPTQVFVTNPYNINENIPISYSSTSSLLNVDTASLELQAASGFYGYIVSGMQLRGETSGAVARVSNLRLISDEAGTLIGSFYIPDATLPSTPSFETGTKTFVLTTSEQNTTVGGTSESTGEASYTASGTINNVEESTLRVRNATIQRVPRSDTRTTRETETNTVASTSFSDRTIRQTRWVDPLAQSFEVTDRPGIFITKVDVFFRTKDTRNLPVTMQVRTMQTGLPTQEILPFGEVILDPSQVSVSEDSLTPTTFTFPSPVYCEGGQAYCVVLLSASDEYTVWISRMGETDRSTINRVESERVLVSQQPLLGSLFKSQNGATWDPSQLEDLKLTIYRGDFYRGTSTIRFYNPELNIGNRQIATLRPNPIDTISRSILVGIAKSLTSVEQAALVPGTTVLQNNNTKFSSKIKNLSGAVGIGSTLTITNVGTAFTSSSKTYSNVDLIALTGNGVGAKINLTVTGGVAVAATVAIGGTGYSYGDALTIDYSDTDNRGKNLVLTIPNNVGVISAFNSLVLDRVQGNITENSTDSLYYVGVSGTSNLSGATVRYSTVKSDGLHFRVSHNNHGMYADNDYVTLSSIEPDVRPVTLTSSVSPSSTDAIVVSSVGILTTFENIPISTLNPGYILIEDEIIKYTGVVTATNSITGIQRNIGGSISGSYSSGNLVYKYELSGVSLNRINKTHNLADVDQSTYPNDLDFYYIKINQGGISGIAITDRSSLNVNSFPELYFSSSKSCGSYDTVPLVGSRRSPKATQNIPFNAIRPNIQLMLPSGTSVSARARTFSGSTPDSSLTAFLDQGFESVALNETNYFDSPRIVASKVNETAYLSNFPGSKSFTLEIDMTTNNTLVSPVIDLDRVNLITIGNRINSKVTNYASDFRVNTSSSDPTAAIYLSKIVTLEQSSDNLKVLFDAYRHSTNDIRVLYRLFRTDQNSNPLWELFPGYTNLDVNKNVINSSLNNGLPDTNVLSSNALGDFGSYEYNAKNLPQFQGFQIKILMSGTNSSYVPLIRDFRAIATI